MSEVIVLTPEERRRFIAYCRQEQSTSRGMAEQMAKVKIPAAVYRVEVTNSQAHGHVADRLELVEEQEVG
jgi:hypothetical protein